MRIDDETAADMGVALNEATLLGVEYDPVHNIVGITVSVLTLPDDRSAEPPDPRRQIILTDIGRIAVALREARWDDLSAKPVPIDVSDLLATVQSFGGQAIYGWEFINNRDQAFDHWKNALSLDLMLPNGSLDNRLMLFQEGATSERHLDLWVWFADLFIRDAMGNPIEMTEFIAGGKRWWDALYAGDPRTQGHGIVPGGSDS